MIIQQILEIIKVLRKLIFLTMKTYFTHISMDMDVIYWGIIKANCINIHFKFHDYVTFTKSLIAYPTNKIRYNKYIKWDAFRIIYLMIKNI